jgi:hypothetical protein
MNDLRGNMGHFPPGLAVILLLLILLSLSVQTALAGFCWAG